MRKAGGGRRVPSELLQTIKAAVNIVDVVGEHVVLRKSGSNYTGLCPFHSERSPSFYVTENKQLYHCHGCKKGGDLLSFVMEIHGLDFADALEELSERARIPLPKDYRGGSASDDPEAQKRKDEQRQKLETAFKLNRFVAAFYHSQLSQATHVDQYFRRRGATDELIRNFYLGAAPSGWEPLASHLVAKKAPLPLATELGLIRPSTKQTSGTSGYFDLFRNRAMFPILDLRGRVAGFGGRALKNQDGEEDTPKYLNSPESILFQKSKLAFGVFQAQKHIREKDEVILVEGYFDVLALHAAGFQNAVAISGTALSGEHLSLFRRYASKITLLFDGDKAGIAATERAMEIGLDHGLILRGAAMPSGLDPDELLFDQDTGRPTSDGHARMETILSASQPILDARLDQAIGDALSGPEAQTQALKRIGAWLSRFSDPVGRDVRRQYVQRRMGVSPDLVMRAMGAPAGNPQPAPIRGFAMPAGGLGRSAAPKQAGVLAPAEKALLQGIARGGKNLEILTDAGADLPPESTLADLFEYAPAKNLVSFLLKESEGLGRLSHRPEEILGIMTDAQLRSTLTEAHVRGIESISDSDFRRALDRGAARCWARFSQRIKKALAEAEAKKDAELQAKLMKEYLDVQRKMKEFTSFYDEA